MNTLNKNEFTMQVEDAYSVPFFTRTPISVERGDGIYVYDENGEKYYDLTSGWGVTCLGHSHPVITDALIEQSKKIIQNPESGKAYSPARARLLLLLGGLLPHGLKRVFFTNSGAEANDAALKLARKASGRKTVVSMHRSFHGRTLSAVSATGQAACRDKYSPLVPGHVYVPFGDLDAAARAITRETAAVIVEPVQGEGGVRLAPEGYLEGLSRLCREQGAYLILDEVQTGFFRTGPAFASSPFELAVDFMTMGKGIAGGFPFAAFAMTEEVSRKLAVGDHGGTYCGNPLGCAVSYAVIRHLLDAKIGANVEAVGKFALNTLRAWQKEFPGLVSDARGKGLLLALELADERLAKDVQEESFRNRLLVNVTQKTVIRLFPALNISWGEMNAGLHLLKKALAKCAAERKTMARVA
ncbi:MAG: aspartate aminotransferase family protein [Endomicrobiales bacterium]